ncbi:ATP-binding cassette domain-containing protein [Cryobacterium sp. Hz7]|uniref:ATP-binding cassette domain-containing protein n=1 Tax=Cryobacterium sp. Hz7 TaxID=1259166 RepID=UPI003515743E
MTCRAPRRRLKRINTRDPFEVSVESHLGDCTFSAVDGRPNLSLYSLNTRSLKRFILVGAVEPFGPVVALADGNIEILPGEIHAPVGENGPGKSTLAKILAGLYRLDAGEFQVDGQPVSFRTVADSKAPGISAIYQEPTLFPDLTVAENIFIGRQPKGRLGLISRAALRTAAATCSTSSACASIPTERPRDCRSPTSGSARSPRPSPRAPRCSSRMSRPPRCRTSRWSACSRLPATCGPRARASSSSRTTSTRCSPSATASP